MTVVFFVAGLVLDSTAASSAVALDATAELEVAVLWLKVAIGHLCTNVLQKLALNL